MHLVAMPIAILLATTAIAPDFSVTQEDITSAAAVFRVSPSYVSGASGRRGAVNVINYYKVNLPPDARVINSFELGYLPVNVKLDNGRCFTVTADYSRTFVNTRTDESKCPSPIIATDEKPALPPKSGLRLVGRSFGFDAWQDDKTGTGFVTNAWAEGAPVIFTTTMKLISIGALRSPDTPGADMTLVGTLAGETAIITVDLSY